MKILLSAFACLPDHGSEPEVGFRALLAAARRHEVWLLTDSSMVAPTEAFLAGHPLADKITVVGVSPSAVQRRPGFAGLVQHHYLHDRWQRRAGERALALDAQLNFDVVHHVTYATYWTRAGVAVVDKPFIWGPVGGGVEPPVRLIPELGASGAAEALARVVLRRAMARLPAARQAQRRATIAFAQTRATADRLGLAPRVKSLMNATTVDVDGIQRPAQRGHDILMIGRLARWKGGHLAVRTLRHLRHPSAVLRVYGDGPDKARMKRAAARWGLQDRLVFEGRVARKTLLQRVAGAGCVIHPSLHDEAALSVAETLALGTPVVCLDNGGPAELLQQYGGTPSRAVAASWPDATARALAAAVDAFLDEPPPVPSEPGRPAKRFDDAILQAYTEVAAAARIDT